jgi:hypothetical protein
MNTYARVILWLALIVVNYYGVEWSARAMTYNSDITFLLGLVGFVLLVTTDAMILIRAFRKSPPKGEAKS